MEDEEDDTDLKAEQRISQSLSLTLAAEKIAHKATKKELEALRAQVVSLNAGKLHNSLVLCIPRTIFGSATVNQQPFPSASTLPVSG